MTDLSCTDYSDKAIVVRGDTKDHKEELKKLGGKYNANLRDGSGWIFSKKNEDKVLAYIASGNLDDEKEDKPNKPVASKPVVKQTSDLMGSIESALKAMDLKERLVFVSNVTRLASSQPVVKPIQADKSVKPVTKVQVTVKKHSSSSDEDKPVAKPSVGKSSVKIAVDSDAEDSDEEYVPRKRLLH
jgi:hypothetical protein